jgi:Na+/proline symporter
VFALCTLAAAVGLPLLVHRRPRQARVLSPLALTWVGSASMATWGSWSLLSATTNPELAAPAFLAMTSVEVITGLWVAAVMAAVLVERFGERARR